MATRKFKVTYVAHAIFPLAVQAQTSGTAPGSQLPPSCLLRVGDLWAERGSEVMERGKLFSSQTISSSADYFYYILGQALLFGEVKRNMSAVQRKLLKGDCHKKMLTSQELGVMAKGLLCPTSSMT